MNDDPTPFRQIGLCLMLAMLLPFSVAQPPSQLACNISASVFATPNRICTPGETVNLSAIVNGPVLDTQWEPAFLVADPNATNTTATINSTTTFTFTAQGADDANLIFNSNFDAGLTGFTSDYIPGTGGPFGLLSQEGQFAVTTNPSFVHNNFANCGDHTGGGSMLVVNGAGVPNQDVWCQVVNVTPNTDYAFSAWVMSVVASSPAQLQFSVNGALLGNIFTAPSNTCNWVEFNQIWNSGPNASVEICIVNQNTNPSGNDFALDDLSFSEVCETTTSITVELVELTADFMPPPDLCPNSFPIDLNTLLNFNATPGGFWSIDGVPIGGILDPSFLPPGPHTVSYTVTDAPCMETVTQTFNIDPLPIAEWIAPPFICATTAPMDMNQWLLPGTQTGGFWTINGQPNNFFDPLLLGVGIHQVSYIAGDFPCISEWNLPVEVLPLPNASWTPPATLCTNSPAFDLNDLLDPSAQPGGSWTIDGNNTTIFDPNLLGDGTFNVQYNIGVGDCINAEDHPITIAAGGDPSFFNPSPVCISAIAIQLNDLLLPSSTTGGTWTINGTPGTLFDPEVLGVGFHTVTYEVGTPPCVEAQTEQIEVVGNPNAGWSPPDTLCLTADTIHLMTLLADTSFMNGTWTVNGIDTSIFNPSYWGIGDHMVSYTAEVDGCLSMETHPIVVADTTNANWIPPAVVCAQDSIIVLDSLLAPMATPGGLWVVGSDTTNLFIPGSLGIGTFAVSYIVANEACAAEDLDSITISPIAVVDWTPPPPLCLNNPTLDLNTLLQPGSSTTGTWTINGQDTSLFHPTDWGEGQHLVSYFDSTSLCPAIYSDTIIIIDQTDASWTTPGPLCSAYPSFALDDLLDAQATPGGTWTVNGTTLTLFDPSDYPGQTISVQYLTGASSCADSLTQSIEVEVTPTADFTLSDDLVCAESPILVTYTGNASVNAEYLWTVDGATNPDNTTPNFEVSWSTPGQYTIQLQVMDGNCISEVIEQEIEVVAPLEAPMPVCVDLTTSSVVISWDAITGATDYIVTVLTGQPGTITGTSITFDGLDPEELVEILVEAVGPPPCGNSVTAYAGCAAASCPDIMLTITPFDPICLMSSTVPISLSAFANGVAATGTWSGPGMTDPMGTFDLQVAGAGVHTLTFSYQIDNCIYSEDLIIDIRPNPTASFDAPPVICQLDAATITFSGIAGAAASYNWNFDGATVNSGTDEGPYQLQWNNPGIKTISLTITENGCTDGPFTQTITVEPALASTLINCQTTTNSIEFIWTAVPGATGYDVVIPTGQTGVMSSDTSYLLDGLTPLETATIELTVQSPNSCPSLTFSESCIAGDCPNDVSISISPVDSICLTANTMAFNLEFNLSSGPDTGLVSWQGPGIIDTLLGTFDPQIAGVGDHLIQASYQLGYCQYTTSQTIPVLPTPTSTFTLPDTICLTDIAVLTYTGSASNNAIFLWDFGDGIASPGIGNGPHSVNWVQTGNQTVQLQVEEFGCAGPVEVTPIFIQDTLAPPVISCTSDYTSMTFGWNTVAYANNYEVVVTDGPNGTFLNDTTYQITGLQPDETASIMVTAVSSTHCPSSNATASCATLPCPAISIGINLVPDLCWDGVPDTLQLEYVTVNDLSAGTLEWSGDGILDSSTGLWASEEEFTEQVVTVDLTYTESVCVYTTTQTIAVFETPTATLTLPDSICINQSADALYTGTASDQAMYSWDFGMAAADPGIGQGPHTLSWADTGEQTISLTVTENGCTSPTLSENIQIDALLEAPDVSCTSDFTSITFSWDAVANAQSYDVVVTDGPTGQFLDATTYQVIDLDPDTEVTLIVSALSENQCPDATTTITCSTQPCPVVTLQIDPVDAVCLGGNTGPQMLTATTTGDLSNGILSWSGPGIIDSGTGLWQPDISMAGTGAEIVLTYTESVCVFRDTLTIDVNETPAAAFTLPDTICISDEAPVNYVGTASPGATYNWNFDGAMASPGSGQGPHTLSWSNPGTYEVQLIVTENGCTSPMVAQTIQVDPELTLLTPNCSSTLTSITVQWPGIPLATSYMISSLPTATGQWLNDTTYIFEDLDPSTTLDITILPQASTTCPIEPTDLSCSTLDCPTTSVSWSAPPVICQGDAFSLDIELETDSDGPITIIYSDGQQDYTWDPDNPVVFTPDVTTTFTIVSIVDASATVCPTPSPDPVTVTVNVPVSAGLPLDHAMVCSGESNQLVLADLLLDEDTNGSWQDISVPPIATGFNPGAGLFITTNTPAGTYELAYVVTGPPACPSDTSEVSVIIYPTPVADAGADQTLDCLVNVVSLGGANTTTTGNLTYTWDAADGSMISAPDLAFTEVTQPDAYTLTVLDPETGCSASDEVIVDSEVAFIVPFASLTPIRCFAANDGRIVIDSIIGGTPPYQIQVNDGPFQSGTSFGPLEPGIYDLTFRDATGCEAQLQFDLNEPDMLQVALISNLPAGVDVMEQGDSVLLQLQINIPAMALDTVLWSPDSLSCKNCLSQTVMPFETTNYGVTIVDTNGCQASDALTLFVQKNRKIFIPNAFSPNNDGDNDRLVIFAGQEVARVRSFRIFSRWGETVFELYNFPPNDPQYGWDGFFRGKPLNSAVFVYMVEVELIDGEVLLLKGDVAIVR